MLTVARTEEDVQRARLIVDTMKWTASKLKPVKYGDRIDHKHTGSLTIGIKRNERVDDAKWWRLWWMRMMHANE